jgi:hypothetical protein
MKIKTPSCPRNSRIHAVQFSLKPWKIYASYLGKFVKRAAFVAFGGAFAVLLLRGFLGIKPIAKKKKEIVKMTMIERKGARNHKCS